jgi:tetrapyrrole methylase family protein/MazG family protein
MSDSGFDMLVAIMARLRGDRGCPWDRIQTTDSLKPFLIEETYEVLQALESGDATGVREELGDLLFHIVFMARLWEEMGVFDIYDVIKEVAGKMVRRHPHVFESVDVGDAKEVEANWSRLKAEEKPERSVMDGIPRALPALMRAYRLTQRASKVGFDWDSERQVWEKVEEELGELRQAVERQEPDTTRDELGDVLLTFVNLARFLDVEPEEALRGATDRFVRRFKYMEQRLEQEGRRPEDAPLAEMDALWEQGKDLEGS